MTITNPRLWAVALAVAAWTGFALAENRVSPDWFPYAKSLALDADSARYDVASFAFDPEVFKAVDRLDRDLRLYDGSDVEIAFVSRIKKAPSTNILERKVPVLLKALDEDPDGRVEIMITRTNEVPVEALEFNTRLRNFEKNVSVYGCDDGVSWVLLADRQPIFDYQRYLDLRNTRVPLKSSLFKHYRIEVDRLSESKQSPLTQIIQESRSGVPFSKQEQLSFTQVDFRIDGVKLIHREAEVKLSDPVIREYPVAQFAVTQKPEKQQTVVAFAAGRAPLSKLVLETTSDNFSRTVTVEGTDDDEHWQRLASSRITRVAVGAFRKDEREISLGSVRRYSNLRVTIDDGDSQPLAVTGVIAKGPVWEGVFFPEERTGLKLLYGAKDCPAPRYDIAQVLSQAPYSETTRFTLGPQRPNPVFSEDKPRQGPISPRLVFLVTQM
jgi:hypothetical protein